jgi:hypothetical protein
MHEEASTLKKASGVLESLSTLISSLYPSLSQSKWCAMSGMPLGGELCRLFSTGRACVIYRKACIVSGSRLKDVQICSLRRMF